MGHVVPRQSGAGPADGDGDRRPVGLAVEAAPHAPERRDGRDEAIERHEIEHAQQANGIRKEDAGHTVTVTPGTLLERTYASTTIEVNSFHHQALRDVAPDLEINAVSPDEVVEAVQRRIGEFVADQLTTDGSMEPVLAAVLRREIDP